MSIQLFAIYFYFIFGIIALSSFLFLFGTFIAILVYWITAYNFGISMHLYPLNFIVIVDFLFIIFSSVLSELANGKVTKNKIIKNSNSLILTSFLICIGTLAPLSTYTMKVGFDVYHTEILKSENASVLSLAICPTFDPQCSKIYLIVVATTFIIISVLCLLNALVIRKYNSNNKLKHKHKHIEKYSIFFSAFGFSVYTLLLHPWSNYEVNIPSIDTINIPHVTQQISALIATFAIIICGIAILSHNFVRFAIPRIKFDFTFNQLSNSVVLIFALIADIAAFISIGLLLFISFYDNIILYASWQLEL